MFKYKEQEREILALKAKVARLETALADTKEDLAATETKLSTAIMWKRVYQGRYEHHLQENCNLVKANEELKRKNKDLEISLRAFKAIINALKRKGA